MDTDDQLLRRFAQVGDRAAGNELIRRHIDFVYAAARRQLRGDRHAAEDVTQAVFLLLLKKAKSVRRGHLSGWLFQTTRYAAANARKVLSRRVRHEREAAAQRMEATVLEQELLPELDDSIAALGTGDREVIVLRYLEGREIADVCQTLGANDAAVRKRLTRAVEKLRRLLSAKGKQAVGASMVVAVLHTAALEKAPASIRIGASEAAGPLAAEILRNTAMMLHWVKIKVAAAVLVCIGVAAATGEIARRALASQPASAVKMLAWEEPALAANAGKAGLGKEALLTMLSEARGRFRSSLGGMRGKAEVEVDSRFEKYSATVEFVALGAKSLVRFYRIDQKGARRLYEVVLSEDDKQTRFHLPGWGHPSAISIRLRSHEGGLAGPPLPVGWSAVDFSLIPIIGGSEAALFDAARKLDNVRVELDEKSAMHWTITAPRDSLGSDARQVELLDFDMNMSGVLGRYRMQISLTDNGKPSLMVSQVECTWVADGKQFRPQGRKFVGQWIKDGRISSHSAATVQIKDWLFADVPPAELTAEALGAAAGTPVVDEITRVEYRFDGKSLSPPANARPLPPPREPLPIPARRE